MKSAPLLACFVAAALVAPLASVQGATPSDSAAAPARPIRVMLEFIELPHAEMTKLLSQPRQSTDDTALRADLARLIDDGKADVLETMLCTCLSGQKATVESNQELIYPTEYEPPELPGTVSAEPKKDASPPAEHRPVPLPTAFEVRNLGSTCEVEPTFVEDEKRMDVRMSPELVYQSGESIWAEWKAPTGDASVRMPKFYRLAVTTSVEVTDGQPTLVASLSPKNDDGLPDLTRKIMVFVRCDVLEPAR